jgi:hypothetical protein
VALAHPLEGSAHAPFALRFPALHPGPSDVTSRNTKAMSDTTKTIRTLGRSFAVPSLVESPFRSTERMEGEPQLRRAQYRERI